MGKRHVVSSEYGDCGIAAAAVATGINYEIVAREARLMQVYQVYSRRRGITASNLRDLLTRISHTRWRLRYFAIWNLPKLIDVVLTEETCVVYLVLTKWLVWPGHAIAYENGVTYDSAEPDAISIFQYKNSHIRVLAVIRIDERFARSYP